jgi:L-threonylcarbamoyladenylate synthase
MARLVVDDPAGRAEAADALRAGAVVALPTDTVYGIGVALQTPGGIERLFHVKHRPVDKGIVLLLAETAQAEELGVMTAAAQALGAACWPGGLTVIVPQRPDARLPDVLTGGSPTIGLRVPDHEAPRALARAIGPMPVTSANVSGQPEAATAAEIQTLLGGEIDLILDGGPARGGPASTVVDCTGAMPWIARDGAVTIDRIIEILDTAGVAHELATADLSSADPPTARSQ